MKINENMKIENIMTEPHFKCYLMSNCPPLAHWQVWLFCRPRTRNGNVLNSFWQVRIARRTVTDQVHGVGCRRRHAQTVIVFSIGSSSSCQRRRRCCRCRRRDGRVRSAGRSRWRRRLLLWTAHHWNDALCVLADAAEATDVAWKKIVKN
jgi:hypothetical protein